MRANRLMAYANVGRVPVQMQTIRKSRHLVGQQQIASGNHQFTNLRIACGVCDACLGTGEQQRARTKHKPAKSHNGQSRSQEPKTQNSPGGLGLVDPLQPH